MNAIQSDSANWPGFLMASVLTGYPDDGFVDDVRNILDGPRTQEFCAAPSEEAWGSVAKTLVPALAEADPLDTMRSDYIDLFDRNRSGNSLYETEYGRDRAMRKSHELADLAGFYQAFGLLAVEDDGLREMPDHISVELEFYAYLLLKEEALAQAGNTEGVAIVADARKKFLVDHLGRFAKSVAERPGVAAHPYYGPLFQWCDALVRAECKRVGAEPEVTAWISTEAEGETVDCGATCIKT